MKIHLAIVSDQILVYQERPPGSAGEAVEV